MTPCSAADELGALLRLEPADLAVLLDGAVEGDDLQVLGRDLAPLLERVDDLVADADRVAQRLLAAQVLLLEALAQDVLAVLALAVAVDVADGAEPLLLQQSAREGDHVHAVVARRLADLGDQDLDLPGY